MIELSKTNLLIFILCIVIIVALSYHYHVFNNHAEIAIIGAGYAGLGAAEALVNDYGFTNVKVYEAKNRVGGRVFTKPYDHYTSFEIGAQFIHSYESEMYRIATIGNHLIQEKESRKNKRSIESDQPYSLEVWVETDGTVAKVPDQVTSKWLYGANDLIQDVAKRIIPADYLSKTKRRDRLRRPLSMDDLVDATKKELNEYVKYSYPGSKSPYQGNQSRLNPFWETFNRYSASGFMDAFFTNFIQLMTGVRDLRFVSVLTYLWEGGLEEQEAHGGNIAVPLKERGYEIITSELLIRVGEGVIELEREIEHINTTGHKAILTAADGSVYEVNFADHVIFTPSVAVLRYNYATMFTPPLPANKISYIKKIGTGCVEKLFFIYEKDFWSPKPDATLLFSKSDNYALNPNDISVHIRIITTLPYPWFPHVLQVWLTYPGCLLLEKQSDQELKDAMTRRLRKFRFSNRIYAPYKVVRSEWMTDRFVNISYGSYFTTAFDKTGLERKDLIKPIMNSYYTKQPILQFAGEATADTFMTAHGAYNSGKREAKRLNALYNSATHLDRNDLPTAMLILIYSLTVTLLLI